METIPIGTSDAAHAETQSAIADAGKEILHEEFQTPEKSAMRAVLASFEAETAGISGSIIANPHLTPIAHRQL